MDLHSYLSEATKTVRNDFVEKCRLKPQIAFKTLFWTEQPKPNIKPCGVLPFITWDWQDDEIEELNWYMLNGGKWQRRKSREIGITWIVLGVGFNLWLFTPGVYGLVSSFKEEKVDKRGNPDTLFYKLDFLLNSLPEWCAPAFERTDRHLKNLWNKNVIDGEATIEAIGRSGRRAWSFFDEFQDVKHDIAASMDRAITDTASCRIFVGTSMYRKHPFSVIGRSKGVNSKFLGWWLHPFKAEGLYWSPDINKIIIEDIDYYREIAPKVFNKYENGKEIVYSELETEILYQYPEMQISFVADGGQPNKPKWRSPWYDKQEAERAELDTATNLDGNEIGAGDAVFTPATINQMQSQYVRKPTAIGEIIFNCYDNKISNIKFLAGGKGRLKWWGELGGLRPLQNRNYVLGCDISLGQGQSNSVCSIFDVDERRKVGRWSDAYTLPEQFAEQVYAIGHWVGGLSIEPLLNPEANGIGQVFLKRIKELGYSFICKSTSEKKGFHQKSQILGWWNNTNNLLQLFAAYNAAMTACFRPKMNAKKFINPDGEALTEAEDYIFSGSKIVLSSCMEDSGGAKAAHGDKCVADALCCLAAQDQSKAAHEFAQNVYGSPEWFQKEIELEEREKSREVKLWLNFTGRR
jgi:hypothetical protein